MDDKYTRRCRHCGEAWNILLVADHHCAASRPRLFLVANAPACQPHEKLRRKLKAARPKTD